MVRHLKFTGILFNLKWRDVKIVGILLCAKVSCWRPNGQVTLVLLRKCVELTKRVNRYLSLRKEMPKCPNLWIMIQLGRTVVSVLRALS